MVIAWSQAHSSYAIGKVVDEKATPLSGVAVVMQTTDSVFIRATTTDAEGNFSLLRPTHMYRLLFQHLAHEPHYIDGDSTHVGMVVLKESSTLLQGVVVTAERPLVRIVDNKLTYNPKVLLDKYILDNAFDLVKELPSVKSDEGKLSLNGAVGQTYIFVNGKQSNMSVSQVTEYLKSLPAEKVDKVEVFYTAPSRFHVKGAAINICLKKSEQYSVQGQVRGTWRNTHVNSYTGDGSLFVTNKKTSFDLLYAYKQNRSVNFSEATSLHTLRNGEIYDITTDNKEHTKSRSHTVFANMDYQLSSKSSVSLSYNGSFSPRTSSSQFSRSNLFSDAQAHSGGNNELHDIRMVYNAPFGLQCGADYMYYYTRNEQSMHYVTKEKHDDVSYLYGRNQKVGQLMLFADMSHSLKNAWAIEYGIKYKNTCNENGQQYKNNHNDADQYNKLAVVNEYTADAYIEVKRSFAEGKFNVSLSLIGELYGINEYKKNALLPNATATYIASPQHVFQLSLNSLRTYPSYWERQDYVSRENEYMVHYGNPTLKPARTSYINMVYVLKNKYMLNLSYHKVKEFFVAQSYQSADELLMLQKTFNMDYTTSFSATATAPVSVGKVFRSNITLSAYNERYKNNDWFGLAYDRNKWTVAAMADNTMTVSKKPYITLNARLFYRTPTIQGIWDLSENWTVDAGCKWSFAGNKAILSLQCSDIFESLMPTTKVRYGKQVQTINSNFYRRQATLSFTYKFNKYRAKNRAEIDTSRLGTH
ncbi:MAG: outer membrane beta-barrel protein [Mediterranea sp.]|jgi:hypothetical protein|nr:outer membrane beta-barrel protein [Mediterranea sp.]